MTAFAHDVDASRNAAPTRTSAASATPTGRLWLARILSGIAILFLLVDGVAKVMAIKPVTDSMVQLGYAATLTSTIGVILVVSTILYTIPATAVLGALLITGYLGGAIATNLRVGAPLFTNVLFPVYVALFVWGGLYLRDARIRALIPFRGNNP